VIDRMSCATGLADGPIRKVLAVIILSGRGASSLSTRKRFKQTWGRELRTRTLATAFPNRLDELGHRTQPA